MEFSKESVVGKITAEPIQALESLDELLATSYSPEAINKRYATQRSPTIDRRNALRDLRATIISHTTNKTVLTHSTPKS